MNHIELELKAIKSLTWWRRLFHWKKSISIIDYVLNELKHIEKTKIDDRERTSETKAKLEATQERIVILEKLLTSEQNKNDERLENYTYSLEKIHKLQDILEKDRIAIQEKKMNALKEEFEVMRKTWKTHEEEVESEIKAICRKHDIEYFGQEDVPFKGKPDNTIVIGNRFVIFDAKSPANDDLDNFTNYVKKQAEAIKKYTKESTVSNDVFLVVPSNTLQVLKNFNYDIGTYRVHIVPTQSLEATIYLLKKIEEIYPSIICKVSLLTTTWWSRKRGPVGPLYY